MSMEAKEDINVVDELEEHGFVPTFTSDVDHVQSLALITQLKEQKQYLYAGFSPLLLEQMSRVLSIMAFQDGDTIMVQGEPATFLGFLLKGELNVTMTDQFKEVHHFSQSVGACIGEIAYFTRDSRTASVFAKGQCIVAVITFDDLDIMSKYAPALQCQLVKLCATTTVQKIKSNATAMAEVQIAKADHKDLDKGKDESNDKNDSETSPMKKSASARSVKSEETLITRLKAKQEASHSAIATAKTGGEILSRKAMQKHLDEVRKHCDEKLEKQAIMIAELRENLATETCTSASERAKSNDLQRRYAVAVGQIESAQRQVKNLEQQILSLQVDQSLQSKKMQQLRTSSEATVAELKASMRNQVFLTDEQALQNSAIKTNLAVLEIQLADKAREIEKMKADFAQLRTAHDNALLSVRKEMLQLRTNDRTKVRLFRLIAVKTFVNKYKFKTQMRHVYEICLHFQMRLENFLSATKGQLRTSRTGWDHVRELALLRVERHTHTAPILAAKIQLVLETAAFDATKLLGLLLQTSDAFMNSNILLATTLNSKQNERHQDLEDARNANAQLIKRNTELMHETDRLRAEKAKIMEELTHINRNYHLMKDREANRINLQLWQNRNAATGINDEHPTTARPIRSGSPNHLPRSSGNAAKSISRSADLKHQPSEASAKTIYSAWPTSALTSKSACFSSGRNHTSLPRQGVSKDSEENLFGGVPHVLPHTAARHRRTASLRLKNLDVEIKTTELGKSLFTFKALPTDKGGEHLLPISSLSTEHVRTFLHASRMGVSDSHSDRPHTVGTCSKTLIINRNRLTTAIDAQPPVWPAPAVRRKPSKEQGLVGMSGKAYQSDEVKLSKESKINESFMEDPVVTPYTSENAVVTRSENHVATLLVSSPSTCSNSEDITKNSAAQSSQSSFPRNTNLSQDSSLS